MNFDKPHLRHLGGTTKREKTRDELVSQLKAERAARIAERRQGRSATIIQSTFRAYLIRQHTKKRICSEWLQQFGKAAASPDVLLDAQAIADYVLPPILFAFLPLKAASPEHNFCALLSEPARLVQVDRLALLCAGVLGGPSGDLLLQTAAARLLMCLTDTMQWGCFSPAGQPQGSFRVAAMPQLDLGSGLGTGPGMGVQQLGAARAPLTADHMSELAWSDLIWAMANLMGLVAGNLVRKAVEGGRELQYLPKSALLASPGVAEGFLLTCGDLLSAATQSVGKRLAGNGGAAAGAIQGLWPLGEGTFVGQLVDCLASAPDAAIPLLAGFYHQLLAALPALTAAAGVQAAAHTSRFVNALAFGCPGWLPKLWRWLAHDLGLPLEAPLQASRGWDIASLGQGLPGLTQQQAGVFGLLCRVYAQSLLVLDDDDFYERQDTFTLAQQRGIATSLNTLVFRMHCPATRDGKLLTKGSPSDELLPEWAPSLLRALYERDVRRRYCPPALWLAPYAATEAPPDGEEGKFLAAAVVRALLQGASSEPSASASNRPAALAALLSKAPQCVPFEQRVMVFRALIAADKERGQWSLPPAAGGPAAIKLTVHRGSLLGDAYAALRCAGSAVKGRLQVTFVNEAGLLEAGLDYGGLVKEFLEEVVKAGFNADYGLFTATPDGLAFPQPAANQIDNGYALLQFLGLVFGKALYEGILLDMPLAPFFVARLQGRRPLFDELAALDPELHRSLVQLKRYEGDAEDLGLEFTVDTEAFGGRATEELCEGGAGRAVTSANKLQYIHLMADWHLNGRLGATAAAFTAGLSHVIPPAWLRLFNPAEVNQLLAGGAGGGVDVGDLRKHATYSGGYSAGSPTVKLFWSVMEGFGTKEREAVLKFVTSNSRAPLGGFQHLNPPFVIHKVHCGASVFAAVAGKDVERLPSASTCFNTLKLPNYRRAATLRTKLLHAVFSGAGFELS
ncbi:hypothetical protein WJX72_010650 [[Myrmecia] bisecta]|uniref:HECT-type E3 ubiquitin transferase n=1 Tax=[Myrmecia] bisecta TaxID=41462 RepID=A0AAW1Q1L8_9CHLO